jgi:hypothetical protein
MNYRKLRIAWSVLLGLAAVMLCVLWVRSYWLTESIYGRIGRVSFAINSRHGELLLSAATGNVS